MRRPLFEEGEHGDEREPLVAVEEALALGDAVCEHRRLQGEVGVLVVRVARRAGERSFERGAGAKQSDCLLGRVVDDRAVELERVVEREVDELEVVLGHCRARLAVGVVLGEDP